MSGLRLRDDVRLDVVYRDETRFGSAITDTCDQLVRTICAPITKQLAGHLAAEHSELSETQSRALMARCFGPGALGALFERPDRLREDCLYPDPARVVPVALRLEGLAQPVALPVPSTLLPELARWIGAWSTLASRPRTGPAGALWDQLAARGALTPRAPLEREASDALTLVGHATVSVEQGGARALFDPFLLPPAHGGSPELRPLTPAQLRPDAVFITHSHPDHYDLGSLLRLGADTPIYVPAVPRESLLSVDMATRLRALGFTRVHTLAWGEAVDVGAQRVWAQPFWGEQPTDGAFLHPEARNFGNVYLVEGPRVRVALLADAGRDHAGDTVELATALRRSHGPVDLVLGGYRAWRLRPIRYLGTSVARYMLSVPRAQWGRRMQLMNDAADLLELGARWGAAAVVPYANGGAPWHWELGLGPRPGSEDNEPDFDPGADALVSARRERTRVGQASPTIAWLQPGQRLPLTHLRAPRAASPARASAR